MKLENASRNEAENSVAFIRKIIEKYEKRLFAWALPRVNNKCDAEDCVQDTILAMIKSIEKFKNMSQDDILLYLIVVVRNRVCYYNKTFSNDIIDEYDEEKLESIQGYEADVCDVVITQELIKNLRKCIDRLEPIYRDVLILKYQMHLDHNEIAASLGISVENARKRLERAKKKLKEIGGDIIG